MGLATREAASGGVFRCPFVFRLPGRYFFDQTVPRISPAKLDVLTDQELLDLRFCDLDLKIAKTFLQGRIRMLYDELEARGITFKPYFWLSSEWFSPDGFPGIAIPFYLAHPRLARLEKRQQAVDVRVRAGCQSNVVNREAHPRRVLLELFHRRPCVVRQVVSAVHSAGMAHCHR